MGGIWEGAVIAVKHHLHRVFGAQLLSFEEMATVLAQIECCFNSRPLTLLSANVEDVEALIPGHFLAGRSLTALPQSPTETQPTNLLKRWALV